MEATGSLAGDSYWTFAIFVLVGTSHKLPSSYGLTHDYGAIEQVLSPYKNASIAT